MANTAMSQLVEWFIANRLTLNLTKTSYSIFGSKVNVLPGTKLCINCKEIKKQIVVYLALLIDSDLKWQIHINYIYNKLIKFVSIFIELSLELIYLQKFLKLFTLHLFTQICYMAQRYMQTLLLII